MSTHDDRIAEHALALSLQLEADGISASGEGAALAMIRAAERYRDLLQPFDSRAAQADVPVGMQLALRP